MEARFKNNSSRTIIIRTDLNLPISARCVYRGSYLDDGWLDTKAMVYQPSTGGNLWERSQINKYGTLFESLDKIATYEATDSADV